MDIVFSAARQNLSVKKWVAPLEQLKVVGLCIYRHFAPLEQGWVLYSLP